MSLVIMATSNEVNATTWPQVYSAVAYHAQELGLRRRIGLVDPTPYLARDPEADALRDLILEALSSRHLRCCPWRDLGDQR